MKQRPHSIETPRLLIRRREADDAEGLKEAIDSSLDHLRRWMPRAHHEPESLELKRDRFADQCAECLAGEQLHLGIFSSEGTRVLGSVSIRNDSAARIANFGDWLRADETRRGYPGDGESFSGEPAGERVPGGPRSGGPVAAGQHERRDTPEVIASPVARAGLQPPRPAVAARHESTAPNHLQPEPVRRATVHPGDAHSRQGCARHASSRRIRADDSGGFPGRGSRRHPGVPRIRGHPG